MLTLSVSSLCLEMVVIVVAGFVSVGIAFCALRGAVAFVPCGALRVTERGGMVEVVVELMSVETVVVVVVVRFVYVVEA